MIVASCQGGEMQPDLADDLLAALDADEAAERGYNLLAATTDEEDDRVIEVPASRRQLAVSAATSDRPRFSSRPAAIDDPE
jgi:hypothetical protein